MALIITFIVTGMTAVIASKANCYYNTPRAFYQYMEGYFIANKL